MDNAFTRRAGLALCVVASVAHADDAGIFPLVAGRYAIRSNMVMPHLEEMRRITTDENRCVARDAATALFPVLRQPALRGCTFGFGAARPAGFQYVLVCASARVASGTVELSRQGDTINGSLIVKMGGKNMTFSQSIRARPVPANAEGCPGA